MMRNFIFIGIVVAGFLVSCGQKKSDRIAATEQVMPDSVYNSVYANRFTIKYFNKYKEIQVVHPWDSTAAPISIVLSSDSLFLKDHPQAIKLPIRRWISVASTQICYANELDALSTLVGIAEPEYVSNEYVQDGLNNGSIRNIGTAYSPDMEVVLSLNPDMMMVSPFKDDYYGPLREAGIKVVTNSSYLENTPLGRVEWLVYFSAFFNKEKEALEKVDQLAAKYEQVKLEATKASSRPSVFSGKIFQGIWYAPAAQSYKANFFKDAGVEYIFKDKDGVGSLTYDFETVYEAAGNCDYWSLLVNYPGEYSYAALSKEDARYEDFNAYKNRSIIYSNTSTSKYYEEGLLRPDLILSDMVKLFHPELLQGYEPVFYKKLTKE
ncbi:ABC transporter substrate-binding protein [Plebeiibacterium sediminum]|uniref:ABC transporter substrate-binding protein n=1 Tax=Plebeiibacterium sediminum TaxID=2992112 RepID=A0AAE3M582_9BACT|nr:ABC transporter substrate-binding protein [Plebeiobacterium sediminum]MCW3787354.1 ABC transporter substrate-binding protein [Plebeiobacterium sediminum]